MLFEGWGLMHGNRGRAAPEGWAWRAPLPPRQQHQRHQCRRGRRRHHGPGARLGDTRVNALQAAYIRKVVDTVNDLDNVLYEVINEGGQKEWDWWVVKTIRDHERTKPKQHPVGITGHGAERLASMLASPADWISPGRQDGYGEDPPAWEAGQEGEPARHGPHLGRGRQRRRGSGRASSAATTRSSWTLTTARCSASRRAGAGSRSGAHGDRARFAERVDLARMEPANELASTGYCLAEPGNEYPVYVPAGSKATVDLTGAAGDLETEWIRPEGGDTVRGRIEGGGSASCRPLPGPETGGR